MSHTGQHEPSNGWDMLVHLPSIVCWPYQLDTWLDPYGIGICGWVYNRAGSSTMYTKWSYYVTFSWKVWLRTFQMRWRGKAAEIHRIGHGKKFLITSQARCMADWSYSYFASFAHSTHAGLTRGRFGQAIAKLHTCNWVNQETSIRCSPAASDIRLVRMELAVFTVTPYTGIILCPGGMDWSWPNEAGLIALAQNGMQYIVHQ